METKKKASAKIKYTAYVAASVDGRIAKSGTSGTDWTSKEDWSFFQEAMSKTDAVIVGHRTYDLVANRLNKRSTIVLTSKVKSPNIRGTVAFLNPKKSNVQSFLRERKYKEVAVVGGAEVYNFCLENNMLDELYVTIEPYIFTAGVPMFTGAQFRKYRLTLLSIQRLNKKGTLLLKYKYGN